MKHFIYFAMLLAVTSCSHHQLNYTINHDVATITINNANYQFNLATLSLLFNSTNYPLTLSASQEIESIAHLKQEKEQFSYQRDGFKIVVSSKDAFLKVSFVPLTVQKSLSFTWPNLPIDDDETILLTAQGEGEYIPVSNASWQQFLDGAEDDLPVYSLPLMALYQPKKQLGATIIVMQPYNSTIGYSITQNRLNYSIKTLIPKDKELPPYDFFILGESDVKEPIFPAKAFKSILNGENRPRSWVEKIEENGNVEKMFGAPHAYLWDDRIINNDNIIDAQALLALLKNNGIESRIIRHLISLDDEASDLLNNIKKEPFASHYLITSITRSMSKALFMDNFYQEPFWQELGLEANPELTMPQNKTAQIRAAKNYLQQRYPTIFTPADTEEWGSLYPLVQQLIDADFNQFFIFFPDYTAAYGSPKAIKIATDHGYLVAPYDSYHSIHPTDQVKWLTAAFPEPAYSTASIINSDGSFSTGFGGFGHHLNSLYSFELAKDRVKTIINNMETPYNAWFMDTDAAGEYHDDYNPLYPLTKHEDLALRIERAQWLKNRYNLVMGSEGAIAFSTPGFSYGHGVLTPFMRWDKEMLKEPNSPYYVGRYYPPEEPAIHFKEIPFKESYRMAYFDPTFHLPLYQAVFHENMVTTHHWSYSSLKSADDKVTRSLTEFLYNVPPLYHLNNNIFAQYQATITNQYQAFYPLHKKIGKLALSSFNYLDDGRLVQQTVFGPITLIANFSKETVTTAYGSIAPETVAVIENSIITNYFSPQ